MYADAKLDDGRKGIVFNSFTGYRLFLPVLASIRADDKVFHFANKQPEEDGSGVWTGCGVVAVQYTEGPWKINFCMEAGLSLFGGPVLKDLGDGKGYRWDMLEYDERTGVSNG